jgi:teichuronic acid biosynthesis glycosyltransferase TuaH
VNADGRYVVWVANMLWEEPGADRRIVTELTRHANILWVDPPVTLATSSQGRHRAARTVRPILTELDDHVTRLTPTAVPGMHRIGVRITTDPLVRAQVRWALRRIGIQPFAVVATTLRDLQGRWGPSTVSALHGTDDYVAGANLMRLPVRRLLAQERRAVAHADVVTALSLPLAERWSALRGIPVPVIPNGCTPVATSVGCPPDAIRDLPRPIVGLIGRLNARIDLEIVEALVEAGYSLLIVGPHQPQWEARRFAALIARSNVRYVGRVPEEDGRAYITGANIGITPYLNSRFNRASFPLKTLDYLSAGRPVVATSLPAAVWLRADLAQSDLSDSADRILALADDTAGFIKAVRDIAGEPGHPRQDAAPPAELDAELCRSFAGRHTWSRRADALAAAIGLTANHDRPSDVLTVASDPTHAR